MRTQHFGMTGHTLDKNTYMSALAHLWDAALALQPFSSISVVGVACTSLSAIIGPARLQEDFTSKCLSNGNASSPILVDMFSSLLQGLQSVGAKRIALFTPYTETMHKSVVKSLKENGVSVVCEDCLGHDEDAEIARIPRHEIVQSVLAMVSNASATAETTREDSAIETPDAVVICASALRVFHRDTIVYLERMIGLPVLTSTQCFLWHSLRVAGVWDTVHGYGTLFKDH